MASIIDLIKFGEASENIRTVNELVWDYLYKHPALSTILTIHDDVKVNRPVGFITGYGEVGVKDTGCNSDPQPWSIQTSQMTWTPVPIEIFFEECAAQLEETLAQFDRNTNNNRYNLEGTPYAVVIAEVLLEAVEEFLWRATFFADTDAAATSDGGLLSNANYVPFFNMFDGLFKQMEEQITANPEQGIAIAANTAATKAAQKANLTPQMAYDVLSALVDEVPMEIREAGDLQILVTNSVASAYKNYLSGVNGTPQQYENLVGGIDALRIDGIPVIPCRAWDRIIKKYYDNGTTYYKPHRALITTKSNLNVGFESPNSFKEVSIHYDWKSKTTGFRILDAMDAKLAVPTLFVLAQ